ncbi:diguanylate cyclase [Erythrobacter sp. JK5]|uniref:GGDEF domain-containing protein n=1 Tax=Erythrobacter sp. JK5 TaxID=2829500 RepID=UPI001BAD3B4D|nr:GGDEF domain-containing protein [Erythrobacter sp. JK5]QUL38327.1 GGDEF domain-containing protein [Erythrobacter sp. JK5]
MRTVADPQFQIAGQPVGADLLVAMSLLLALVALVGIVGVMLARRETRFAARLARQRAGRVGDLLRTIRMAESIAELGVWQYDPATGRQSWSHGIRALFGAEENLAFAEKDAANLLLANEIDLVGSALAHRDDECPFELQFDIVGFDGIARTLAVHACNLPGKNRGIAIVVAVVRDVTDQVERERRLEQSRAVAVSEARRARQLAATDALTGLANRRRVQKDLERIVRESRHSDRPLALIVFDIDHFKRVNDTHGHLRGDQVIRRVAEIALAQARDSDLVGRVGGEEFIWVIPGADANLARVLAERLRHAVSLQSSVGPVPAVTVSVGFAALSQGDSATALFARADAALHSAKSAGRNRVRRAA